MYEAYDRDRAATVALKILSHFDTSSIFRLKREFRALADLAHPNLVGYHELVSSGDFWFFTMELVDGVDFLTHVSGGAALGPGGASSTRNRARALSSVPSPSGASGGEEGASRSDRLLSKLPPGPRIHDPSQATVAGLDLTRRLVVMSPVAATATWGSRPAVASLARATGAALPYSEKTLAWLDPSAHRSSPLSSGALLRPALRQLALGLEALHASGVQHRDVKPSNVMVGPHGRVVILDFGLATQASDGAEAQSVQGTPAYMAPEQAYGHPTAASDLYAVGVMIFEALTGRVPFDGSVYDVLAAKQLADCPRPSTMVAGVDPDLDELAFDLLRRAPNERPRPADVLRRLDTDRRIPEIRGRARGRSAPFVGRERHMDALRECARRVREGRAITATVHGISGMGKSALVKRFLDELRQDHAAIVLRGRCYERESVPYKALDALMDALSRLLLQEPPEALSALLPPNIHTLARLFPVLLDVPAVAIATRGKDEIPDVQELRRRGFAALRELLTRLARDRLLVLSIDDLQWGDADSAALLSDLLRPPSPPPLLLLCSFRSDEAASSPFLRELVTAGSALRGAAEAGALDLREIEVGPLGEADGARLALELLHDHARAIGDDTTLGGIATALAREAEGSPFFLAELARAYEHDDEAGRSERPPAPDGEGAPTELVKLDQVVRARVRRLSDEARALLEVVAVAGRPVEQAVALRAAGQSAESVPTLGLLRAEHLVRTRGVRLTDFVEPYHDRIREAVTAGLGADRRKDVHRALGLALEADGRADPESLAEHFTGAGDRPRARKYARQAAERAAAALAFERAATLYREALDHTDAGDPTRWRTARDLAGALANAGRGAEASKVYRDGAKAAPPGVALDLERLAAEHACRSGHVDEGLELFRKVTAAVGMRMASSPAEALASLLARRALVRIKGLSYTERSESSVDPELLKRIDVAYSVSTGLGMVDPIQGADFQARLLLLALEAGEPVRLARALAVEACYSSTGGESTRDRTRTLVDAAEGIARRVGNPLVIGTVESARAFDDIFVGRWRKGLDHAERAEALFRESCTNVAHEIATAQIFGLWALFNLGEIRELLERCPQQIRHAEERGDLFAAGSKRTLAGHVCHLCLDDVAGARETVRVAMAGWSQRGFHVQHWYELLAEVNTDLYSGDARGAHRRIESRWKEAERSLLFRVVSIRNDIRFLRARTAVAAAITSPDRRRLLDTAEDDAKAIRKAELANSEGWARTILGAVAHLRGRDDRAIAEVRAGAEAYRKSDMALWATLLDRRQGELRGGAEGARAVERADAWMKERGIVRPERLADTFAPGFAKI